MEHKIAETNARIDVADVLRGLAVMGIILLHSIEHFNFYSFPEEVPFEWMKFTDQAIWRGLFFTFSNKAYAVFALLFGFSFYTGNICGGQPAFRIGIIPVFVRYVHVPKPRSC